MTTQNYLVINQSTNVVENVCLWDGNTNTWQPPQGYLMLVQDTTPAMVWQLNADKTDWVLGEEMGVGGINFTWNGTACITNESKPPAPPKPKTEGLQTL